MTVVAGFLVICGLAVSASSGTRWRSGGGRMVLVGVSLTAIGAFLLVPAGVGPARYLTLAVPVIASVAVMASVKAEVVRALWLQLLLAGGAMVTVVLSELVVDANSSLQTPLMVLLAALTLGFIGSVLFQLIPRLRHASKAS